MPDFELPRPSEYTRARAFVNRKEVPCTVNGNIITLDIPPSLEKKEEEITLIYPYEPKGLVFRYGKEKKYLFGLVSVISTINAETGKMGKRISILPKQGSGYLFVTTLDTE